MGLLWDARQCYRRDSTVQQTAAFYHKLRGESVTGLSSEPNLSSQLASNSNQTLGYLPCPTAQGTPHRYAALFHGSGNSLQTGPKAPGFSALSEVLGCWRVGPQRQRLISAWPEAVFRSAKPLGVVIESFSTHGIVAECHKAETSIHLPLTCAIRTVTHVYPWAGC